MSLAGVCVPSGSRKTLLEGLPVGMKACSAWSRMVPTCDVAPLSAMADGIDPFRTAFLIALVQLVTSCKTLMLLCDMCCVCSSSWQVGGAVSDNIA